MEEKKRGRPKKIKNQEAIQNGPMSEAILGFNPGMLGTQVEQVDTLFVNLRYYLVSNMRQPLSQAYVELGLVQAIVDTPVADGFRGGVDIKTKQLDEDQLYLLQATIERQEDLQVVAEAVRWNRLFGGSGVVIITEQDPESELDMNTIQPGAKLEFRAADMWELFWSKQSTSDYSQVIDSHMPEDQVEFYNYYGQKVHKSRVIKMKGIQAPSFVRPRLRGWGVSVVETLIRSINQYLKSTNLVFEVLDEFKIDVYKIKNLVNTLMSPNGAQKVMERVQLANKQKNYQNAITMDSEDDYAQKELSFTGIAETMDGIKKQIAADMRMPLTKIFGISASGFSSGEDDIENYNAMIESQVREKSKFGILKVIELRCQQLFGFIPTDLSIEFKPLRMLNAEQEENVKTAKFNRLIQAKQAGLMTDLEFREACNHDNLFPIQLDTTPMAMGSIEVEDNQPTRDPETLANDFNRSSLNYLKLAYEADGGDKQFAAYHEKEIENLPDQELVKKCEDESEKIFGKVKWQFVFWAYKFHGGKGK